VTTYQYDDANRLERVTAPLTREWAYTYDQASNLKTVTDAIGNSTPAETDGKTTFSYDELNRLSGIDYSDTTPDVGFTYDANSNRASMSDGSGTEAYGYDDLDRLKTVTRGSGTFAYNYDDAGNLEQRIYPDGTVTDYTFYDDNLLKTVTSNGKTTTYGYDAAGNLTSTTLPAANGQVETRTYDHAGRTTEVKSMKLGNELVKNTYVLDSVGNPTSMTTQDEVVNYEYDDLYRLTKSCYGAPCATADEYLHYTYDDVGNRLTETRKAPGDSATATTYTYNAADELQSLSGAQTKMFGHDLNGNQTSAGPWTYTYDSTNRMTSAANGTKSIAYSYDGDGKRLKAATTQNQATTEVNYKWDSAFPLPEVATETDASGNLLRRYIYGHEAISMSTGGADYFFHHDRMGSVTALTSSSGAAQWKYDYEPFGALRSSTRVDGTAPTNLMGFLGALHDTETGLLNLRARQLDSSTGRFSTRDPWRENKIRPHVSTYAYAHQRPTVFSDPSGLRIISLGGTGCTFRSPTGGLSSRQVPIPVPDGLSLDNLLTNDDGGEEKTLLRCVRGTWHVITYRVSADGIPAFPISDIDTKEPCSGSGGPLPPLDWGDDEEDDGDDDDDGGPDGDGGESIPVDDDEEDVA
jgi:RHS repeat-associated protein